MWMLFALRLLLFVAITCWVDSKNSNIIFLLTDDQDVTANSLDFMPLLDKILRKGGAEFPNYFVPTGLCCPSRATIVSGQYCHNTKIWDNGDLNNATFLSGGFKKALATNIERVTVATELKSAGYETMLCGKYLNGYDDNEAKHVPSGWDHWTGMTDTAYYGPHFSVGGKLVKTGKSTYQTDYIRDVALDFLTSKRDKGKPFFMYLAPFAPHAPATPAKRHENMFKEMKAPRYDSFNPDDSAQKEKPSWLGRLPKLTQNQIDGIDNFYRNRLRSLQAVDEMLQNITDALESEGILNETYIFYMGDNGQHLGDYRLPGGKRQAFDTDIRVPFFVRGPGVPAGKVVREVIQSIDLFPTWADIANVKELAAGHEVDGKSIMPVFDSVGQSTTTNAFRSVALAEMFGGSSNMGGVYKGLPGFEKNRFWNNTYQAIRVINGTDWAAGANWMYAEWCTGEKEFYNLTSDPREINNLAGSLSATMQEKLAGALHNLGTCAGKECQNPDFTKTVNYTLVCHNPPDMQQEDDLFEETSYGFPFSDSDFVPAGWL
ncbi:N-acetylglucosamine-6-sulfatase-like [Oscarella lobularis]|uniref:N-acetylglucosamine-6-sulfatase-like n=1 Tax=Oscarella lobularis TaxID=121494 RepID=UPI0033137517